VLETLEDGRHHHYLIPSQVIQYTLNLPSSFPHTLTGHTVHSKFAIIITSLPHTLTPSQVIQNTLSLPSSFPHTLTGHTVHSKFAILITSYLHRSKSSVADPDPGSGIRPFLTLRIRDPE
jgi:hypothetical protein